MNWKTMMIISMAVGLLLAGCASSNAPPTGYYGNNPQGGQPQGGQYVGGGCGLAASDAGAQAITGGSAAL